MVSNQGMAAAELDDPNVAVNPLSALAPGLLERAAYFFVLMSRLPYRSTSAR